MKIKLKIFSMLILVQTISCSSASKYYLYTFKNRQSYSKSSNTTIYGLRHKYSSNHKKIIAIEKKAISELSKFKALACRNFTGKIDQFKYSSLPIYSISFTNSEFLRNNTLCQFLFITLDKTQYLDDPHGHAYYKPPFYNFALSKKPLKGEKYTKKCEIADCLRSL